MKITAWLRGLGLQQYQGIFDEHGIDFEALSRLGAQDLKSIGVSVAGHRRMMLAAIAAQRGATARRPRRRKRLASADPERRQVTLMFCDLVGSTMLSVQYDPEDLRDIMAAYRDACEQIVAAYGGYVARYTGDGMLAYFGFPRAFEEDAERAVRAGLDLVAAVGRINTPEGEQLRARVGVATGIVVVGDLVGTGSAQEQTVIGETPNLAARLQQLAEPGTVVVAEATRRLLGSLFTLRDLGRQPLKGFPDPVPAWAVEREAPAESRFEAVRATGLTGFVGRERETELLLQRKRMAFAGQGQVVLICGEAGIGKSRLASWLGEQLKAEPHRRLLYQCSPYHTNSTLYPFVEQLKRQAQFEAHDSAERQCEKLEAMLAELVLKPSQVHLALLAELLSIPSSGRYAPLGLSPAQQRRQTVAALLTQLEQLANCQPLLVIFEDFQWADATTQELFDGAVERLRQWPALVFVTCRPEFEPPWAQLSHVRILKLHALDAPSTRAMIAHMAGGQSIPPAALEEILAKTDGVPLFIEEFTKNLLECGLLAQAERGHAVAQSWPPQALPSSLRDLLLARLDRLGRIVKEVAQVAAVLGREFSYRLLQAVCPISGRELNRALGRLVAAELLQREGKPPASRYTFRHALIADSAYSTLLRNRHRELHGRVARVLEQQFPDVAASQPELVAHHFSRSDDRAAAVDWWERAGLLALRRGAYAEASRHLGHAIETLGSLAPDTARDRRELDLRMRLRLPLLIAKGYGTPEADPNYARLEQLAESLAARPEQLSVLNGRCVVADARCDFAATTVHAQSLIDLSERCSDSNGIAVGLYHLAFTAYLRGELASTQATLNAAFARCQPERSDACRERYNFEVIPALTSLQCLTLQQSGLFDQATALAGKIVQQSRQSPSIPTQYIVFSQLAVLHMLHGTVAAVRELAIEVEQLAQRYGSVEWQARAECLAAWLRGRGHPGQQQWPLPTEAQPRPGRLWGPLYLLQDAELLIGHQRQREALALVSLAQSLIEQTGQQLFMPEAKRLHTLASRELLAAPEVEVGYLEALALARRHNMKLWELRTALSCAELWRDLGRDADARQLLAPVYGGLTEGFGTSDVRRASALLDRLC